MDYYDDDPTGDDEVTALWNGQLPMDSVLKVLQHEIERHKAAQARIAELEAQVAELVARAEAAERRVAELEASREHFQMLWVSDGCKYAQFADDLVAALKIELPDEYEDDEDGTLAVIVAKVAELEARLASATVRFIDGIGYLTLPEPVATSGAMHYGEPAAIE